MTESSRVDRRDSGESQGLDSDKEDVAGSGSDVEGRPAPYRTEREKQSKKSVAQREEVAARVVRIAAQCRERSEAERIADLPLPIVAASGGASSSAAAATEDVQGEEGKASAGGYSPLPPPSFNFIEGNVIIFDWDDTLFPTWFITEVVKPSIEESVGRAVSSRSQMVLPPDSPFAEALREHSKKVDVLLRTACAVGRVGIVTLAQRPWVITSARRFLLGLDFEELIKELKIPIVYARESIKRSMVNLAESEEGVNVLAVAKQRAMAKALKKLYGKDLGAWRNVISVGDSRTEKDAMKELLWSIETPEVNIAPPTCKTVKLMEEPSIEQLGAELDLLRMWLPPMVSHLEDFDIVMDDSEETMLRMHEGFGLSAPP